MRSDGAHYAGLFDRLSEDDHKAAIPIDYSCIAEAISSAFDPIRTIVRSAWSEHAPFLFALFSLVRPRRYVEIGTERGMSFFAACQAAETLRRGTQCVAIDSWMGDEHAGFYGKEIFEEFTALLNLRRPANAYFIRSYFSQALPCFDEGSIDLLHIDGLHTYETVKADFESWLPKMSARGTVIFHDTNVYHGNFGVWRFWNEVKLKYPHFQLPHQHGLGVIYIGAEPSPLAAMLRELQENPGLAMIVINFFANLGAMSTQKSILDQDLIHAKTEKDAISAEAERLRTTLGTVRSEKDAISAEAERLRSEKDAISAEAERLRTTLGTVRSDAETLRTMLGAVQSEKNALSAEVQGLQTMLGAVQSEKNALSAEVEGLRMTLGAVWGSSSWKLTKPVRTVGEALKAMRHYLRS